MTTNTPYYKDNPRRVAERNKARLAAMKFMNMNQTTWLSYSASFRAEMLRFARMYLLRSWKNPTRSVAPKTRREANKYDGYVYLIWNPAYGDWIKVGRAVDPHARLAQYQTSDPKRGYRLLAIGYTDDRIQTELRLMRILCALGVPNRGEWFQISAPNAIRVLGSVVDKPVIFHV